jgi:hypothetical protein
LQQQLVASGKLKADLNKDKKENALNKIVYILLKKKGEAVKKTIQECTSTIQLMDLPFPTEIHEFLQTILDLTSKDTDNMGLLSLEYLEELIERKQKVSDLLVSLLDRPEEIICSYIQNSTLEAVGDITVIAKGGFYSTLNSGGDISVQGVFRGGEILAEGDVFVNEAGSPGLSSGDVKIKVHDNSTVKIRKAFPETAIQVGNRFHIVKTEQRVLKVQLNEEGEIFLGAFS